MLQRHQARHPGVGNPGVAVIKLFQLVHSFQVDQTGLGKGSAVEDQCSEELSDPPGAPARRRWFSCREGPGFQAGQPADVHHAVVANLGRGDGQFASSLSPSR